MQVTRQQIEKTFGMPLHQAALVLNCSIEDLRAQCRVHGIKRWPFRKRSSSYPRRNSLVVTATVVASNQNVKKPDQSSVKVVVTQTKQIPQLFNNFSVIPENHEPKWFNETFNNASEKEVAPHKKFQSKFNIHKLHVAVKSVPEPTVEDEYEYEGLEHGDAMEEECNTSRKRRMVYEMMDQMSPANKVMKKIAVANSENNFHPILINQVNSASLKHQTRFINNKQNHTPQVNSMPLLQHEGPIANAQVQHVSLSYPCVAHETYLRVGSIMSENGKEENILPPISTLFKAANKKKTADKIHVGQCLPSISELMTIKPQKIDAIGL